MKMSLTSDLLDIFDELGCPIVQNINLDNVSLKDMSLLLNWISLQLQFFAKTDSIINKINDEKSDLDAFKIELNSLLNELGSIYSDSCSIDNDIIKRQLILHSLSGDLLAARINHVRKFDENLDIFTNKLNPKTDIKIINNCLSISSDPNNLQQYFQTVKEKLNKGLLKCQEEDSLLLPNNQKLNEQQWNELKKLNQNFQNEYSIRREMLLRRADMTVNSFGWNEDDSREIDQQTIQNIYNDNRKTWSIAPNVTLSHALASRSSDCDSLINKRISMNHASCLIQTPQIGKANIGLQQRLQLHKFLIGSVPDRGGRPFEQPPPPKETFEQQRSQRENRGRGGGGGGQRGGHRDNRRMQQQPQFQDNYQPNHFANFDGSSRIQGAGWQQQQDYQQNQDYYQDDYRQQQQYSHRGRGYHQQRGRGGHRGGGGGRFRDYY